MYTNQPRHRAVELRALSRARRFSFEEAAHCSAPQQHLRGATTVTAAVADTEINLQADYLR